MKALGWTGGIATLILLAWFLHQLFGPHERIIVSPETTVITEPLRADGLPDYGRYFYELGHEGVTPQNNGAVQFWQAMWPGDLSREDWLPMCEALGMETVPEEGSGLETPYTAEMRRQIAIWLTERYQRTHEGETAAELLSDVSQRSIEGSLAEEVIDEAMDRPWKSEQVPALGEWVERNQKQLDLLVSASKKDRYWSPSPSLLSKDYEGLISVYQTFGSIAQCRTGLVPAGHVESRFGPH